MNQSLCFGKINEMYKSLAFERVRGKKDGGRKRENTNYKHQD